MKMEEFDRESTWPMGIPSVVLFYILSFGGAKVSFDFSIVSKACKRAAKDALNGRHRTLLRICHSSVEALTSHGGDDDEDDCKCKLLLLQLVSSELSTGVVPSLIYGIVGRLTYGTVHAEHLCLTLGS